MSGFSVMSMTGAATNSSLCYEFLCDAIKHEDYANVFCINLIALTLYLQLMLCSLMFIASTIVITVTLCCLILSLSDFAAHPQKDQIQSESNTPVRVCCNRLVDLC